MPDHVFLSYSHADDAYATRLIDHLAAAGIPVWSDHGVDAGSQWLTLVRAQVDRCAAFVVVMTPAAGQSTWVARELERAEAFGRPVVPLLLAGEPLAGIATLHYEDVRGAELPSARFVERLREFTGATPPAAQPAGPDRPAGPRPLPRRLPWPVLAAFVVATVVSVGVALRHPDGLGLGVSGALLVLAVGWSVRRRVGPVVVPALGLLALRYVSMATAPANLTETMTMAAVGAALMTLAVTVVLRHRRGPGRPERPATVVAAAALVAAIVAVMIGSEGPLDGLAETLTLAAVALLATVEPAPVDRRIVAAALAVGVLTQAPATATLILSNGNLMDVAVPGLALAVAALVLAAWSDHRPPVARPRGSAVTAGATGPTAR